MTSFLEAMDEFVAEGAENSQTAAWIDHNAPGWQDPAAFETFVEAVKADALPDNPRPDWHVPCTTLWWVDGEDYLGRIAIRHTSTTSSSTSAGTSATTYAPRGDARVTRPRCCEAALPWARDLGIDPALVTCDDDNVGFDPRDRGRRRRDGGRPREEAPLLGATTG